jgi:hypothetical protein
MITQDGKTISRIFLKPESLNQLLNVRGRGLTNHQHSSQGFSGCNLIRLQYGREKCLHSFIDECTDTEVGARGAWKSLSNKSLITRIWLHKIIDCKIQNECNWISLQATVDWHENNVSFEPPWISKRQLSAPPYLHKLLMTAFLQPCVD